MDNREVALSTGIVASVLEAGAGGRPLLLIHGFTGAKDDFADHVEPLAAEGWHVVAPDLRGHGTSGKPSGLGSYSLKTFAGDVLALADALGWGHFALLGHSMGGMVAQLVALEAPERIVGLILMNTAHGPVGGVDPDILALGKAVVAEGGMELLVQAQRGRGAELASAADRRLRQSRPGYVEFGEAKAKACAADMWLAMVDEIVDTQADRLAELTGLALPTLVIVGEQDTGFTSDSKAMASAIPGARLAVIADAGHSPQFENPTAWFAAVGQFLHQLPG